MDESERLCRILEEASQQVKELPEWRRSEETNREPRELAEEQRDRRIEAQSKEGAGRETVRP